jgi:hypothetical protein
MSIFPPAGDICAWKYAKWMKKDAQELYSLQSNGIVKVREAGMYYIYGQVSKMIDV